MAFSDFVSYLQWIDEEKYVKSGPLMELAVKFALDRNAHRADPDHLNVNWLIDSLGSWFVDNASAVEAALKAYHERVAFGRRVAEMTANVPDLEVADAFGVYPRQVRGWRVGKILQLPPPSKPLIDWLEERTGMKFNPD